MGGGVAVRSTEDGLSKELDRSTKTGVCKPLVLKQLLEAVEILS
jgi:hypothetical protein